MSDDFKNTALVRDHTSLTDYLMSLIALNLSTAKTTLKNRIDEFSLLKASVLSYTQRTNTRLASMEQRQQALEDQLSHVQSLLQQQTKLSEAVKTEKDA